MGSDRVNLSAEFVAEAERIIGRYPVSRRSAVLPLLHHWQEHFGYISSQGMEWIAGKLGLEPVNVLELVTFYPMLREHPAGKVQIKVCRTLSCALAGSYELYRHLRMRLKTGEPDAHGVAVTEDGRYSVEFVECLAACGGAPVVMVNEDHYENVTPKSAEELIERYSVRE